MNNIFYKENFIFKADRYEEWQAGRCISQGLITTKIVAEVENNTIHFELDNIENIRMLSSFDFDILGEDYCILPDRIQYSHSTSDYNPIVPIVCNIFYRGNTMQYVRFAMTNPDRLVEFYGKLENIGQKSADSRKSQSSIIIETAETIIRELKSYGMFNVEAIMERAVKLYNNNANVRSISEAKAVIESLKLFVKAYQLELNNGTGKNSILKPKILMFIALCNYKIDNVNRAYCIAKQGLDAVDEAIANSIFVGLPKSMYGADTLEELIDVIEEDRFDEVEDEYDYYAIDPREIDTNKFEEIISEKSGKKSKPSEEEIRNLIEIISHIQSEFSKIGERTGDAMTAYRSIQTLEAFKLPLCYAWQCYKYGWHTDFCKEGDSLLPFLMFEANIVDRTKELINMLKNNSPFARIERNSAITNSLLSLYSKFIEDLDNGDIKI